MLRVGRPPVTFGESRRYRTYLRSPAWRLRRWWWYMTSTRRCEDCGTPLALHRRDRTWYRQQVLEVHHKTYARLGHERRSDVALLCGRCHRRRDAWRYM